MEFDPQKSLIVVKAEVSGPTRKSVLRMGIDTGATCTILKPGPLIYAGYDPAYASERVQVTTGS